MIEPVMYLFLNKGAQMSTGKAAAQAAHAAVEAFRLTGENSNLTRLWYKGGHYTKIVLEARDESHMRNISDYIKNRGFMCEPIIDEGRTEVDAHTLTALGCALVDRNDPHTKATFESFSTYKDDSLVDKKRRLFIRR